MNMQTPTHNVEQGTSYIPVFRELCATVKQPFHSAKPVKQKGKAAGCDSSPPVASGVATPHQQPFAPLPVVQITCAADIKPEAIRWLWNGWLACGKFHIFAGQAGTGKTTIAVAISATISKGGHFPDGTPNYLCGRLFKYSNNLLASP
jgi:hypothetical protein